MQEKYNPLKAVEFSAEQNYNMIDGVMDNTPPAPVLPEEKPLDKVEEPTKRKRNRKHGERQCPDEGEIPRFM